MKKIYIYRILKFSAYAFVVFVLLNFLYFEIVVKKNLRFINRMESITFDNPDFDVLVLGASTAFDAFDTGFLTSNGIKSYNLAMGGVTARASCIQLEEYLDNYSHKPEYVLLGNNAPLVQTFDSEMINPIIELTREDHKFCLNDVPILSFKWLGFEFLKTIVSEKHRKAELVLGQLKFQKTIPDLTSYKEQDLNFQMYESSHWLGELVQICDANDIKVLFFELPGYKATQNQTETGLHKITFSNGCTANLYNYNSQEFCSIFEPNIDWIGNSHLNEFGAIKFTQEIIRLLTDEYYAVTTP